MKEHQFATRAIHEGSRPDPVTGAVIPPISVSSTYVQESPGVHKGFDYGRSHNPTRFGLEDCLASLECGVRGFAFSSGLAAAATILDVLPAQSHIIAVNDLYGGTFRLFERVRKHSSGLSVTYLPLQSADEIDQHIQPNTKMIWVETPTNPMLTIVDLEAVAERARRHNLISVADNTFASPALQQPLLLGFDLVVHSTTKYLNGHSDVIGGAVIVRDRGELEERLAFIQNAVGSVPGPFDCFLVHRGIKTLDIRVQRHSENAQQLAEWLEEHPGVKKVIYPGLPSHPQYKLAKKQMRRPGGMISLVLNADLEGTKGFLENVHLFSLAESLGGVESLIEHPAIMTHATIPPAQRETLGIVDSFVRLSVGIEAYQDLREDLDTALRISAKG